MYPWIAERAALIRHVYARSRYRQPSAPAAFMCIFFLPISVFFIFLLHYVFTARKKKTRLSSGSSTSSWGLVELDSDEWVAHILTVQSGGIWWPDYTGDRD